MPSLFSTRLPSTSARGRYDVLVDQDMKPWLIGAVHVLLL